MPPLPIVLLLSYLAGSIPFGFLAGRLHGIDIRDHGSGNIGATNVLRTLGKTVGIIVFVLDVLKGFVPVFLVALAMRESDCATSTAIHLVGTAVAVILGHNFPVWLKFKGGKGIATSAGALIPLMPLPLLAAFAIWVTVFFTTRYVSLASLCAALAVPATLVIQSALTGAWNPILLGFAIALWLLATWRHRANIGRLLKGTENRFERKPKSSE